MKKVKSIDVIDATYYFNLRFLIKIVKTFKIKGAMK